MKTTYYIGVVGSNSAGKRCNGCAESIEQLTEGAFTNLQAARRAAAQIAVQWANEPFAENQEVCLAVVREGDRFDDCLYIAKGIPGRKTAKWD